ncbi:MAG: hypothetical protein Q9191_008236, partial [Dirinaria sp. TL-2023a]
MDVNRMIPTLLRPAYALIYATAHNASLYRTGNRTPATWSPLEQQLDLQSPWTNRTNSAWGTGHRLELTKRFTDSKEHSMPETLAPQPTQPPRIPSSPTLQLADLEEVIRDDGNHKEEELTDFPELLIQNDQRARLEGKMREAAKNRKAQLRREANDPYHEESHPKRKP